MKVLSRAKLSPFEQAVSEALQIARELRQLEDPATARLSAAAYLAHALRAAGRTAETLEGWDRALRDDEGESGRGGAMPRAAGYVRTLERDIAEGHVARPPASAAPLAPWDVERTAIGEVAGLGITSYLDLFAVAVLRAVRNAKRHPGAFGKLESWAAFEQERQKLRDRFEAACQRADSSCGEADREYQPWDETPQGLRAEGYRRSWYRISAREVACAPGGAESLVRWLLSRPHERIAWAAAEKERELAPLAEQLQGKSDLDAVTVPAGFTIPGYMAGTSISGHAARELVATAQREAQGLRERAAMVEAAARRVGAEA